MSDIQRYHSGVGYIVPDNNGKYVEYDDHIAEVNRIQDIQVKQAEAMWKTNAENETLQARIDELEEEFRCLDANYVSPKQIKAEGIREMLLYCMVTKPEMDEYGVPVRIIDIDDIEHYADKLEKGDE